MASAPTLEDALTKIARDNNLTSLTIGAYTDCRAGRFGATAHWDGFARSGNACQLAAGSTFDVAIADVLAKVAADRTPPIVEVAPLPTLAEVA